MPERVPTLSEVARHPNAAVIEKFYQAFQRRDARDMITAYHRDIHFSDEVFTDLRGNRAGAMWRMLCDRAADLKIEYRDVVADDRSGRAHWEAWYTFTATGRKVHNVIEARFEFRDGRMVRHRDTFDFWRWSRQAIGPLGVLFGWSPFLKKRVRREAAHNLDRFIQKSQALTQ